MRPLSLPQAGTSGDDGAHAIVSGGSSSEVLLTGFARGDWLIDALGKRDFAAVLLNTNTPTNTEPTLSPTGIPTPGKTAPPSSSPFGLTTRPSGQPSDPTPAPTLHPTPSSSQPTSFPTLVTDGTANITTLTVIVAVLSCILGLIGVVAGGWLYRRHSRQHNDHTDSHSGPDTGAVSARSEVSFSHVVSASDGMSPSQSNRYPPNEEGARLANVQERDTMPRAVSSVSIGTALIAPGMQEAHAAGASTPLNSTLRRIGRETASDGSHQEQKPSVAGTKLALPGLPMAEASNSGVLPGDSRPNPTSGLGIRHAMICAAQEVSLVSQIPGVAEVASLVIVLMNLLKDNAELTGAGDGTVKRCRSVLLLVKRAADVLDEVGLSCQLDRKLCYSITWFHVVFFICPRMIILQTKILGRSDRVPIRHKVIFTLCYATLSARHTTNSRNTRPKASLSCVPPGIRLRPDFGLQGSLFPIR